MLKENKEGSDRDSRGESVSLVLWWSEVVVITSQGRKAKDAETETRTRGGGVKRATRRPGSDDKDGNVDRRRLKWRRRRNKRIK